MENYEPLERKLESAELPYRRVADRTLETVREGFRKPYVERGVGLGAATLVATLLTPNEAYAAQDGFQQTAENYGFVSGLLDRILDGRCRSIFCSIFIF